MVHESEQKGDIGMWANIIDTALRLDVILKNQIDESGGENGYSKKRNPSMMPSQSSRDQMTVEVSHLIDFAVLQRETSTLAEEYKTSMMNRGTKDGEDFEDRRQEVQIQSPSNPF